MVDLDDFGWSDSTAEGTIECDGWSSEGSDRSMDSCEAQFAVPPWTTSREEGSAVSIHVYSVGKSRFMRCANKVFRNMGAGIFHAGVEVHGTEWSFAAGHGAGSGIWCGSPGGDPSHSHLVTIPIGRVRLDPWQVQTIVSRMAANWEQESYDLFRHNCCHFVCELLKELQLPGPPTWLLRSTNMAAKIGLGRSLQFSFASRRGLCRWGSTSRTTRTPSYARGCRQGCDAMPLALARCDMVALKDHGEYLD